MAGPLTGLLVADFSRVLAGPYATMLLADMGADVIKVESPGGDETREWMPKTSDGLSTYFLSINRNKRSVVLDLKNDHDAMLAKNLTRRADVVIENFMPGTMARFGLDYSSMAKDNPKVIYASISGFGDGAGADLPGYDFLMQAMSGVMSLTGPIDGAPYRAGVAAVDIITGLHVATGVLAALHQRSATGQGQYLQANLMTSALSALSHHASTWIAGGIQPRRYGNGHPSFFPYDPFPTADGEIIIIAANDQQFARLCNALGLDHLVTDARFSTNAARVENREQLRALLAGVTHARTNDDITEVLRKAHVPCGPVLTIPQAIDYATTLGLDPVVNVDGVPTVRNPLTFTDADITYSRRPPALDADGPIIRQWLQES